MFIEIANASAKAPSVVNEVVAHAAETQASQSVLASLGINSSLFIAQLINFTIVAIVLWFLILKPLTKKMAERQDKIEDSLKNAEKVEENLRKSEQSYQSKIDDAKAEAAKIMEKSQTEAKELGDKMKNKSKEEIELLITQAKKNIQIEKEEMLAEIKVKAGELVVAAMEKVLDEKIDDGKDKEMILRSVKNIKV